MKKVVTFLKEANEELANKLLENNFDDALLFSTNGETYLDFYDRESIQQTIKELELISIKSKYVQES